MFGQDLHLVLHTEDQFEHPLPDIVKVQRALSQQVAFEELRAYRNAVGRRTREIVSALTAEDMLRMTPPERLQRGLDEGAISPAAPGLVDYWGSLTAAGLLLMPPTRHCYIHLNECLKIKKKAIKQVQ